MRPDLDEELRYSLAQPMIVSLRRITLLKQIRDELRRLVTEKYYLALSSVTQGVKVGGETYQVGYGPSQGSECHHLQNGPFANRAVSSVDCCSCIQSNQKRSNDSLQRTVDQRGM